MKKVAIIGGGILGLTIAQRLLIQDKEYNVTVFEKEDSLGRHQSGNNSGVLHCGLHYKPGSLKSKLAVNGIREMIQFCKNNKIDHEICGKVVLANTQSEINQLDILASRGKKNGLKGIKYLSKKELKKREPFVRAKKAIIVPEEGIINYKNVLEILSEKIEELGGEILFKSKVLAVNEKKNSKLEIVLKNFEGVFDLLINCSGLFSDKVFQNSLKIKSPIKIIPFRGEYLKLSNRYKDLVNHLIYPTPNINFPFLGVHFTRMITGTREVGPNAVFAFKREGYRKSDFSVIDTIDSLSYVGLRKFISKNLFFTSTEFLSSLSRKSFVKKAKNLIPDVEDYMFEEIGTSGVRAQAIDQSGNLVMDFKIEKNRNQIHILNAPSPGATASFAIASYIFENYVK